MYCTALATATTPGDSMADADLAARAANGDGAAFQQIMPRHDRLLFRTARSILKSDARSDSGLPRKRIICPVKPAIAQPR